MTHSKMVSEDARVTVLHLRVASLSLSHFMGLNMSPQQEKLRCIWVFRKIKVV